MEKILSIVIPAYNVEKYLGRCLASVEKKDILDEIEVLIINDGSQDKTAEVAKYYCEKYPNTYFLYEKENGGHGSGINYGIKYATGKYFKVVDGDDWLKTEEMPDFLQLLKKTDVDVVAADYECIQDETYDLLEEKYASSKRDRYGKVCRLNAGEISDVIKMHALTIKTNILKDNHIVIDEHCYYVDCEYITYPIPYVNTVYFYPKFIYQYRLGRNGQSMNIKSMQKNREQHMRVLNHLLQFYRNLEGVSTEATKYIEKCIAQVVENQFQIYISMGLQKGICKELRSWDKKLKEEFPQVYRSTNKKSIDLLRRTNYVILPIGVLVYKLVKR